MDQIVKNLPTMREVQLQSLGSEDPLEKGINNPLQYSCLENPHGHRSPSGSCVHGVAKSRTQLRDYTFSFQLANK